jgi:hypothetical protein
MCRSGVPGSIFDRLSSASTRLGKAPVSHDEIADCYSIDGVVVDLPGSSPIAI